MDRITAACYVAEVTSPIRNRVPVSGISPLAPLPVVSWEEADAELRSVLEAKVARLGYFGGFFAELAHAPRPLAAFERFTAATRGELPEPVAETIALTIAGLAGNDYERVQHERMARTHGHDRAWIDAVLSGPDAIADPVERAAARLGWAVWHRDPDEARVAVASLSDLAGAATASASLLLCGRFLAHAAVSSVLDLRDPTLDGHDG